MAALPTMLSTPLYTVAEAARLIGTPKTTLGAWARGYDYTTRHGSRRHSDPLVTEAGPGRRHYPTVPFVGLAEAAFLAAIRRTGVPMQRIRPALDRLRDELGIEHALASRGIYTDGAEILYKVGRDTGIDVSALDELVVVRNNQGVFTEVILDYLQHVTFGSSGYAEVIRLPRFGSADVIVDPRFSFGQPVLEASGVAIEAVLDRFDAGESIGDLAIDFEVAPEVIEQLLRASRQVAA